MYTCSVEAKWTEEKWQKIELVLVKCGWNDVLSCWSCFVTFALLWISVRPDGKKCRTHVYEEFCASWKRLSPCRPPHMREFRRMLGSLSKAWQGNPIIPRNSFQSLSPQTHTHSETYKDVHSNTLTHPHNGAAMTDSRWCKKGNPRTEKSTCLTNKGRQNPCMSEDAPSATWWSPDGWVNAAVTDSGHAGVGSWDFLSLSVDCCSANGASVDVCKSVHEPGYADTRPVPLAHSVLNQYVLYAVW